MRHAVITGVLCSTGFFAAGARAEAVARFDHVLARYPTTDSPCLDVAGTLAARFEQQTGVEPLRVGCENAREETVDIRITYVADAELPLVTTFVEPAPDVSAARFPNREACEAEVARETERFERLTGLQALVSYCYAEQGTSLDPWAPRIDAFGTARVFPSVAGELILGMPVGVTHEQIEAELAQNLSSLGYDVTYVKFSVEAASNVLATQVYGEQALKLDSLTLSTATLEQCEQGLADLRGILASDGALLGSFCGHRQISFEVDAIVPDDRYEVTDSAERFSSYAECRDQRDAVVDVARSTSSQAVLGGVCSFDVFDEDWSVGIVSEAAPRTTSR